VNADDKISADGDLMQRIVRAPPASWLNQRLIPANQKLSSIAPV
jgi:hypothetical protein